MALAAVAFSAQGAHAEDRWRAPYAGVRHLHRRSGTFDYHLLRVDLAVARPRFVSTEESFLAPRSPGARRVWRTTSDFARHVGADVAVNANYFDIRNGRFGTCGLAMSGGRAWRSSYADRRLDCDWTLAFGPRGRVEIFDSRAKVLGPAPWPWVTEAVTGSPRVLTAGEVDSYTHPRHALQRNPRTLLGVDQRRATLFVMMVNGREGRNQGMTCPEAARVLRGHGAWDAVNLDGGGSSALYVRAEGGLVSHPADGVERGVANHLGMVFGDDTPEAPAAAPEETPEAPAPQGDPPTKAPEIASPEAPPAPERRVVRAGCAASPVTGSAAWPLAALALAWRLRSRGASRRSRETG
ncbi:MAG: phosphodiester glycosidase family protein [Polyangiales bacterium]